MDIKYECGSASDKGTWRITSGKHIEDYDTCHWQDAFIANNDPQGNPDRLAQLIPEVAKTENPPLHLAIGADALAVLDAYAEKIKSDTDAWREKAVDTSY